MHPGSRDTVSTPAAFVHVTFHATNTTTQYISVGGSQAWPNSLHVHLRPRGDRAKLNQLVVEMQRIWDDAVQEGSGGDGTSGRLDDAQALHNIFIMEDIAAGAEQGFVLPVAGQEGAWVEENMGAFEKRAREGDESMAALVEEVKRGLGN